jgi:hypothetical protein
MRDDGVYHPNFCRQNNGISTFPANVSCRNQTTMPAIPRLKSFMMKPSLPRHSPIRTLVCTLDVVSQDNIRVLPISHSVFADKRLNLDPKAC